MQIRLCMRRGYQRLQKDMGNTISGILFNVIMALGMYTHDD
jgi:ATP-binding cassette subfamily G (WHITE) protein 2 (PDR)